MTDDPVARAVKRAWDARFMQAIARLEEDKRRRERCGGCGRQFWDHPNDYAECVRKVLALDDET